MDNEVLSIRSKKSKSRTSSFRSSVFSWFTRSLRSFECFASTSVNSRQLHIHKDRTRRCPFITKGLIIIIMLMRWPRGRQNVSSPKKVFPFANHAPLFVCYAVVQFQVCMCCASSNLMCDCWLCRNFGDVAKFFARVLLTSSQLISVWEDLRIKCSGVHEMKDRRERLGSKPHRWRTRFSHFRSRSLIPSWPRCCPCRCV